MKIVTCIRSGLIPFLFIITLFVSTANAASSQGTEEVPDFSLPDLDGVRHTLSEYSGKIVLINFWASWCGECLVEMPTLDVLYKKYRDEGVMVLGISIDRNRETVRRVMEKVPVSYPVFLDSEGEVFIKKFTVTVLPTTFIVDRDGLVRERLFGAYDFGSEEIYAKIRKLLEAK